MADPTLDIKRLREEKLFGTTNVGDLYSLFCEVALALARPDGGVVTMIVPLSIAFGQKQITLRDVFSHRCTTINLRHYNHMPDTLFNASPTVRQPMNGQRTTIFTAIRGSSATSTALRTTGLVHWASNERAECLHNRRTIDMPKLRGVDIEVSVQWSRVPTNEVARMIQSIVRQNTTIESLKSAEGRQLGVPKRPCIFSVSRHLGKWLLEERYLFPFLMKRRCISLWQH